MSTPQNFQLMPMNPQMRPKPVPSRVLKRDMYTDVAVFKQIDQHAISEARTNYRTFRDLIYNLVFKKSFSQLEKASDLVKARVIFRWMTMKNMYTIIFDGELPGSPEAVIGGFKDGKTTYANIYETLCSYAGLHCITLSGWAKGVDYRPGMQITRGPINHSWNACYIDGNWHLVDCHWATRYLQSEKNVPENLVYEYDDFYFLADAQALMYSHCPEETIWQLVHPTKNRADFEDYPLIKSYFFTLGMQLLQQTHGVIYAKRGIATITIGHYLQTACTYKLAYGEGMIDTIHGINLKRYVLQETTDNRVSFYFRAPREGSYYITMFAQMWTDKGKADSVFKATCEYKIICDTPASDIRPFPVCADNNWGPGIPMEQYNLVASHKTAILSAPGGQGEISFARRNKDIQVYARLIREGMEEETLEDCVAMREQDDRVFVTMFLPMKGEYGLEIYANDPDREGDTFTHVCQYLVTYSDRSFENVYGQVFDRNELLVGDKAGPLMMPIPDNVLNAYNKQRQQQQQAMRGGPGGPGGPGGAGYPTQDWDEAQLAARRAKEEADFGAGGYGRGGDQRMQRPGGADADRFGGKLPAEMMDQNYQHQLHGAGIAGDDPYADYAGRGGQGQMMKGPGQKGPGGPGGEDQLGSKAGHKPGSEEGTGKGKHKEHKEEKPDKPIEVVYVSGPSSETDSPAWKKSQGGGDVAGGPGGRFVTAYEFPGAGGKAGAGGKGGPNDGDNDKRGGATDRDRPDKALPSYLEHYPFDEQADMIARRSEPEQEYTPHPQKQYTSSIQITPPQNFEITAVEKEDAPKPEPPSVAPKPFKDVGIFQNVDSHAVEVSKLEHSSFRELVWHLIYARNITNELEKARAIFLWLCSKDLSKLNFNDVKKGSPEDILLRLKEGKTTYAVVYETLCSYAGLYCNTITGYAKGAEYKPGMHFTGDQGQHSWNTVMVNGAWRLVDCHWAARRLVGRKITVENVRYELDEYYFMPDPEQLIFTHYPDDKNWQLLATPVSIGEFENMVPVKSAFFKFGLQILSHRNAVIQTRQEITLRISCPPHMAKTLAFTFTLSYEKGGDEFQGTKLNRFGMQEMVENVSFFTLRPPRKDEYHLIIYAKDLSQQSKEGVYGGVCEYVIDYQEDPYTILPFPPCAHTSWGPGDSNHKYGLVAQQKGAIFSTVNGMAEVKFKQPKEYRYTAKLKSSLIEDKDLQNYCMQRVVGDTVIFTITAPAKGEYGLEIYANDPEVDGNSLFHAYQYLFVCPQITGKVEPLPPLPPNFLGQQVTFKKLGLTATSHVDPFIQSETGEIIVTFGLSQAVRMTSQLVHIGVAGKPNEDCTDYILQQTRSDKVEFVLRLPKAGMYKFQLYAQPKSDSSESLPSVYNYLINCRMTRTGVVIFPKQYGQWKEGCYLYEPIDGFLQMTRTNIGSASRAQNVYFKLSVPSAKALSVVVGDVWTPLQLKQPDVFEGEANLMKHWNRDKKLAVCANYTQDETNYSTLLEYSM